MSIVSDSGPQFTSGEFENFTKQNGIKHYKSAPFHPATNGLVERFVQTFKNSMRAMKQDKICLGIPVLQNIIRNASIVFVDVVVFIWTTSGHFE
jgi:transposase InsO family protein